MSRSRWHAPSCSARAAASPSLASSLLAAKPPPILAILASRASACEWTASRSVIFWASLSRSLAMPFAFSSFSALTASNSLRRAAPPPVRLRARFTSRSRCSCSTGSRPSSALNDSRTASSSPPSPLPPPAILATFSPSKKNSWSIPRGMIPSMNCCQWGLSTASSGANLPPSGPLLPTSRRSPTPPIPSPLADHDLVTSYSDSRPPWKNLNVTETDAPPADALPPPSLCTLRARNSSYFRLPPRRPADPPAPNAASPYRHSLTASNRVVFPAPLRPPMSTTGLSGGHDRSISLRPRYTP